MAGAFGNACNVEFLWRPHACSAFNINQYLGAANYEVELLPSLNWHLQCLESLINVPSANVFKGVPTANPTALNQYYVNVSDIQYFIPICGSVEYVDNLSYYLSLSEYEIQSKPFTIIVGTEQPHFSATVIVRTTVEPLVSRGCIINSHQGIDLEQLISKIDF